MPLDPRFTPKECFRGILPPENSPTDIYDEWWREFAEEEHVRTTVAGAAEKLTKLLAEIADPEILQVAKRRRLEGTLYLCMSLCMYVLTPIDSTFHGAS